MLTESRPVPISALISSRVERVLTNSPWLKVQQLQFMGVWTWLAFVPCTTAFWFGA